MGRKCTDVALTPPLRTRSTVISGSGSRLKKFTFLAGSGVSTPLVICLNQKNSVSDTNCLKVSLQVTMPYCLRVFWSASVRPAPRHHCLHAPALLSSQALPLPHAHVPVRTGVCGSFSMSIPGFPAEIAISMAQEARFCYMRTLLTDVAGVLIARRGTCVSIDLTSTIACHTRTATKW